MSATHFDDSFSQYYVQCQEVGCYDCEGVVDRATQANRMAADHEQCSGHSVSVQEVSR